MSYEVIWDETVGQDETYGIDEIESWDDDECARFFWRAWFWPLTILLALSAVCESVAAIKKHINKKFLAAVTGLASILKHKVLEFEFIGSFEPGDVVRINSDKMQVTLNDGNALHLVEGDFPMLRPGEQELIYIDEEGVRKVRARIRWKARWL